MQIHTTARHFELDPEDRLFAEERLTKLTRFARDLQEAHLVVTAEGFRHSAEITLRLKRHDMVSREESVEARLAIDLAADHLEKQLRKLKDRRVTRKRSSPGLEALNGAENPAADDVEDAETNQEE
jgi:putative sigma-54 modulation protein